MDAIDTTSKSSRASARRGRRSREFVVVALGLLIGLAAAVGPRVLDDAGASRDATPLPSGSAPLGILSTQQVAAAARNAGADLASLPATPDLPDPPAPSATAAVDGFLAAETSGSFERSYGLLSAEDRARAGGRVAWAASHVNLPPITGFAIEAELAEGDTATVVTRTDLRAGLDEVVGLVPAHARSRWVAVREDGGWRVAYGRSRLEPQYPPDALAIEAAREWITARQACRQAAEWSGGLVGSDRSARRLCGERGPVVVGAPTTLPDDADATSLTAAFGPDVYAWARWVPITGPVPLDLIVAPVGERWLVVGAAKASASAR